MAKTDSKYKTAWVLEANTESGDHYIVRVFMHEPTERTIKKVLKEYFDGTDETVGGKLPTVYSKLIETTLEET